MVGSKNSLFEGIRGEVVDCDKCFFETYVYKIRVKGNKFEFKFKFDSKNVNDIFYWVFEHNLEIDHKVEYPCFSSKPIRDCGNCSYPAMQKVWLETEMSLQEEIKEKDQEIEKLKEEIEKLKIAKINYELSEFKILELKEIVKLISEQL